MTTTDAHAHADPLPLEALARLPAPADNVAIATRTLAAGQRLTFSGQSFALDRPVLEGHRLAVRSIEAGEALLSWGMPFGWALSRIPAGAYVCNAAMLAALQLRSLPFDLPAAPNFSDYDETYTLDPARFQPGVQVPLVAAPRTFLGYPRPGGRGAGTRNTIVLLAANSRTGSYVRALEDRLRAARPAYPRVDGIVAVAHTEGGEDAPLNNRALLLRTLAGFMVHPNVGAVLVADDGGGGLTNASLRAFAREAGYPLDSVPHAFMTLTGDFDADLAAGAARVRAWLPAVNTAARQPIPLAQLNVALQCGGSDAFSGVSANPLAAAVVREVIRHGGAANLAETTELIGAEAYLLQNVRDLHTARALLGFIAQFKALLAWHGVTGEGNLSGGNRYRGLYNISLKSLGAAIKRDPAVRLDYAVDYAERMAQPGFYFMNTPGNDLESIAGQVAGGSNLIIFTTGNGSITNFPFVPTIKVMTTSARYRLLAPEMDVNAGAYLDGVPLETLTQETLDLAVAVASGAATKGERAGHAQVSIWRNWRQTSAAAVGGLLAAPAPTGRPLPIRAAVEAVPVPPLSLRRVGAGLASDQVGLILPTSLCAGQIARLAANRLNALGLGRELGLSRFAALVHTEGCGVAGHSAGPLYTNTLLNYMRHPLVGAGLFLEHGCEKTHNDYMRHQLEAGAGQAERYGWASVQLDGGIEAVLGKIEAWFRAALAAWPAPREQAAGLEAVRLGLMTSGPVPAGLAQAFSALTRSVAGAGGTVVVPESSTLLAAQAYTAATLSAPSFAPSLAYGQAAAAPGFHVMQAPSAHWVETLTGLGATGVEVVLAYAGGQAAPGHPFIPTLRVTDRAQAAAGGFDLVLTGAPDTWPAGLLGRLGDTLSRRYVPRQLAQGEVDFQLTRGLLGVSV